jgi:hypothetical protein
VTEWVEIHKDPKHIAREKRKAKALRQSQWWRNKIAQGVCTYCQQTGLDHGTDHFDLGSAKTSSRVPLQSIGMPVG